ncbi:MAG TPA: hypothetical protein PK677_16850 [Acidiphilium sp.]|uniref:hypothetical protein n=1 Tax=Acidiphilium sp. 37-64-53 TaxID=1970299 RepID=UPI00257D7DCA|nr:hypothetical protein [Acidiphilium sp. 37-64-53]HQT90174.1 hypothetical protein [Acidiphilium sp.]
MSVPPPPNPDPHTSLCSRCQHSQIEVSNYTDKFERTQHQILVHCLKIHEVIFWSPDGLFGETHAICRLPASCTGFREKKEQEEADGLSSEMRAALQAFQTWTEG